MKGSNRVDRLFGKCKFPEESVCENGFHDHRKRGRSYTKRLRDAMLQIHKRVNHVNGHHANCFILQHDRFLPSLAAGKLGGFTNKRATQKTPSGIHRTCHESYGGTLLQTREAFLFQLLNAFPTNRGCDQLERCEIFPQNTPVYFDNLVLSSCCSVFPNSCALLSFYCSLAWC